MAIRHLQPRAGAMSRRLRGGGASECDPARAIASAIGGSCYNPPVTVGYQQPEEWEPCGHETAPPRRVARLKQQWKEV